MSHLRSQSPHSPRLLCEALEQRLLLSSDTPVVVCSVAQPALAALVRPLDPTATGLDQTLDTVAASNGVASDNA
jgi:hypothetical protein